MGQLEFDFVRWAGRLRVRKIAYKSWVVEQMSGSGWRQVARPHHTEKAAIQAADIFYWRHIEGMEVPSVR